MTKPTFTRLLKKAQTLSGAFPIDEEQRDDFYDELKGELDEDIEYALKRIWTSGEKITYPVINSHVQERVRERTQKMQRKQGKPEDKKKVPPPPEAMEALNKLFGQGWNGQG